MILAVDQGGAIGWSDGRLPWKLSADMRRFKELTTGCTVVMGFNTFKSLGLPKGLPNRRNIVLTRRPWSEIRGHFDPESDTVVISSLDWVKRLNGSTPADSTPKSAPIVWIIGGKSVYEEALQKDLVDEIYMTLVHSSSPADVRMDTDLVAWKRFVLTERKRGVNWEVTLISRQWDGDIETSYITFKRA
jgi:dihydrofolate reductase